MHLLWNTSRRVMAGLSPALPFAKLIIPRPVRRGISKHFISKVILHNPDRVFMRDVIIPYILRRGASKVLSVGVRDYTVEITDLLTKGGAEVWTLDIDPKAQAWGVPGRHIVGDAMRLDEIEGMHGFSCILFNGVLGYGINTPADIGRTLTALSAVLPADGLLILGWNVDRIPDPAQRVEFGRFRHLQDEALPSRATFPGSTHVYDFLEPADAT